MDTPTTGPAQATPDEAAKNTGADSTGTPPGDAAPQAAPTPAPAPGTITLTQAQLDKMFDARLAEDRKRRADEDRRKAQQEAGEFKSLYEQLQAEHTQAREQHAARVAELEARVAALSTAVNDQIAAAIKGWPKAILVTDPGTEDVTRRQEWFAKVAPEVGSLALQPAPPPGPHAPPPAGLNGRAEPSQRQQQVSGTW